MEIKNYFSITKIFSFFLKKKEEILKHSKNKFLSHFDLRSADLHFWRAQLTQAKKRGITETSPDAWYVDNDYLRGRGRQLFACFCVILSRQVDLWIINYDEFLFNKISEKP